MVIYQRKSCSWTYRKENFLQVKRLIYMSVIYICVLLIVISSTVFCFRYKPRYICMPEDYKDSVYIEVDGDISFKDYPDTQKITDKAAIKKIFSYLNNLQVDYVYGYFSEKTMEFEIPELDAVSKGSTKHNGGKWGMLEFYTGRGYAPSYSILISNERYIEGINYHVYKTRNKDTSIISELEALELK